MLYKYLQIEDNPLAAQTLDILMQEYDDFGPTIISCDIKEGLKAILTHKPDVVFLDVELPDFTGFEFLTKLKSELQVLPAIIMTTAHEKYALKAVNEDILYYLLKPLDPDELFIAINRFRTKKAKEKNIITYKTTKGYSFLPINDIFLIKSSSNYTYFFTTQLEKVVISKTMKEFEPYLNEHFLRVHKSFIINTQFVKQLNTVKKKVQINFDALDKLDKQDDFFGPISTCINEQQALEIPIGEAFLDKVKHSLLYNKII